LQFAFGPPVPNGPEPQGEILASAGCWWERAEGEARERLKRKREREREREQESEEHLAIAGGHFAHWHCVEVPRRVPLVGVVGALARRGSAVSRGPPYPTGVGQRTLAGPAGLGGGWGARAGGGCRLSPLGRALQRLQVLLET